MRPPLLLQEKKMVQELDEIIERTEAIIVKLKRLRAASGEILVRNASEPHTSPWKEVSPEDLEADWRDGEVANNLHE
jgi:hypothetical protein